jgi:hypothetical protein
LVSLNILVSLKMTDELKHASQAEHGSYERQDLQVSGILYFLLTLGIVTLLCIFGIRGLYAFLDHRARAVQPPISPLITNVPEDTRHIPRGYPQATFPNPRLEEDERGQLNDIRLAQENTLYSYGWVDQQAGTVRIPIDRAIDLLVQRGLPVRQDSASAQTAIPNSEILAPQPGETAPANKARKKSVKK